METNISSSNRSDSKTVAALESLDKAEENVFKVLSIAHETLQELQNMPTCDMDKINELSLSYIDNIKDLRNNLVVNADILFATKKVR